MERIMKEFVSAIKEPEEIEADTHAGRDVTLYVANSLEIMSLKKQGAEALNVAKAWAKSYTYDHAFAAVYKASLTFLHTPPVAPLPFPLWLRQLHVANEVERAAIAKDLWAAMQPDVLQAAGYAALSSQRDVIIDMLKAKFTTHCQSDGLPLAAALATYCVNVGAGVPAEVTAELALLHSGMRPLVNQALPSRSEADETDVALRTIAASKCLFSQVLTMWPNGQSMLARCRSITDGLVAGLDALDEVTSSLGDLGTAIERGLGPNMSRLLISILDTYKSAPDISLRYLSDDATDMHLGSILESCAELVIDDWQRCVAILEHFIDFPPVAQQDGVEPLYPWKADEYVKTVAVQVVVADALISCPCSNPALASFHLQFSNGLSAAVAVTESVPHMLEYNGEDVDATTASTALDALISGVSVCAVLYM
jgi:hypothetical protein